MLVKAKQYIAALSRLLPSKKYAAITGSVFLCSVMLFVLFPQSVHAQELLADLASYLMGWIIWAILLFAKLFISITIFLLRFFIQLASYNGYLDAPMVLIGWRLLRDIANMFFVVILLVIAFATIVGKESYEWKRTMVKMILAAIFINFSLLLCGLVIDAAHVFTVTFLNAIAPVAGGNLINMFNLDEIRRLTAPENATGGEGLESNLQAELFIAAVVSVVFSAMAMITIGLYTFMLLFRLVYLWILLIMSPLAFAFMVLPATQSQANEWIQDFTKYILVGPVMVFFLWLAFATMGNAGEAANILIKGNTVIPDGENFQENPDSTQQISANVAASWHASASFLIAIGFLIAGVDRVQKLGVSGGNTLSNVKKFGVAVGTIASGYAAGRFLYEGGSGLAAAPIKTALKTEAAGIKDWYYRSAVMDKGKMSRARRIVGTFARRDIARQKRLKKTEGAAERSFEEAWAGAGSEFGGRVFGTVSAPKANQSRIGTNIRQIFGVGGEKFSITAAFELPFTVAGEAMRMAGGSGFAGLSDYKYLRFDENGKKVDRKDRVRDQLYAMNAEDRDQKGRLKAKKERSEAKTGGIESQAYARTLAENRIKDGKDEGAGKGTYGERIAGWQLTEREAKARAERIKKEAEGALITGQSAMGPQAISTNSYDKVKDDQRTYQKRRIAEERKAKAAADAITLADETQEADFLEGTEGQGVSGERARLQRLTKLQTERIEREKAFADRDATKDVDIQQAMRETKEAELKKDLYTKEAETREQEAGLEGMKSGAGDIQAASAQDLEQGAIKASQERLTQEGRLAAMKDKDNQKHLKVTEAEKAETEALTQEQKAQEAAARQAAYAEELGAEIVARMNLAEQGIKAADQFVERLKKDDLSKSFEDAAKLMADVLKNAGDVSAKQLQESLRGSNLDNAVAAFNAGRPPDQQLTANVRQFIRALEQEQRTDKAQEGLNYAKAIADSGAAGAFVELESAGFTTPATAFQSMSKRITDALSTLEAPSFGRALADTMGNLAIRRERGEELTSYDRAFAFGVVNKVTAEAYVDDAINAIADQLNRLERHEDASDSFELGAEEAAQIAALRKDFTTGMMGDVGTFRKDDSGKWVGINDAAGAALIQNYGITGGDKQYIEAHLAIEKELADPRNKGKKYMEVAEDVLGTDGAAAFKRETEENDSVFQEATAQFKRSALATGHIQNGSHQWYDDDFGGHRLATGGEAETMMRAEVRKRGSKVGYQYHSFGRINGSTGLLEEIDRHIMADLIGHVKKYYEAKNAQDRTVDGLLGMRPSQEKVVNEETGAGVLGTGFDPGKEDDYIKNSLLPAMLANPQFVAMLSQRKFGNTSDRASEAGHLNVQIEGLDNVAAGGGNNFTTVSQIAAALEARLSTGDMLGMGKKEAEQIRKELAAAKVQMQKTEAMYDPNYRSSNEGDRSAA